MLTRWYERFAWKEQDISSLAFSPLFPPVYWLNQFHYVISPLLRLRPVFLLDHASHRLLCYPQKCLRNLPWPKSRHGRAYLHFSRPNWSLRSLPGFGYWCGVNHGWSGFRDSFHEWGQTDHIGNTLTHTLLMWPVRPHVRILHVLLQVVPVP